MYLLLLLLLLLSVTLCDVGSSKAKCPSFATLKIEELPAPAAAPQVTLVCTFTYHDGVILPAASHKIKLTLQNSRDPLMAASLGSNKAEGSGGSGRVIPSRNSGRVIPSRNSGREIPSRNSGREIPSRYSNTGGYSRRLTQAADPRRLTGAADSRRLTGAADPRSLKVFKTFTRMLWDQPVRCGVVTPDKYFCEEVVTIARSEREIGVRPWTDSTNCAGAILTIDELPRHHSAPQVTVVCKLTYNEGASVDTSPYWMGLYRDSSPEPLKNVSHTDPFLSSTATFIQSQEDEDVLCVVITNAGHYCQARYTIPRVNPEVEQHRWDDYLGCPPSATIEVSQLQPNTDNQVSLKCKFNYCGGSISRNKPYDHHLGWFEVVYTEPYDQATSKPWASYNGLENPTGIIEGEHPNLTVFNYNTVEGGEGLIQEFKVDMTEMFGDPHVLTSTLTFTASSPPRDVRCLVYTSDHHRCTSSASIATFSHL